MLAHCRNAPIYCAAYKSNPNQQIQFNQPIQFNTAYFMLGMHFRMATCGLCNEELVKVPLQKRFTGFATGYILLLLLLLFPFSSFNQCLVCNPIILPLIIIEWEQ